MKLVVNVVNCNQKIKWKFLPVSFTMDFEATCTCIRSHSSLHRHGISTERVSAVLAYPWC